MARNKCVHDKLVWACPACECAYELERSRARNMFCVMQGLSVTSIGGKVVGLVSNNGRVITGCDGSIDSIEGAIDEALAWMEEG